MLVFQVVPLITGFIFFWLVFIGGLLQVMFFTTCERKLLALVQRRVGPRFVGMRGRLQYLADSLKLLVKVYTGPRRINATMFQGAAFAAFWMSWFNFGNLVYGPGLDVVEIEYNVFFLISISLGFSIAWLLAGWASSSKYALLGCLRAGLQLIGFELLMGTVLLIIFVLVNSFNFEGIVDGQRSVAIGVTVPTLAVMSLLIFFMETNRPPFDISEAESDLVAGYNVEYGGILFGLFYLGEYLNLFAASTLLVLCFCGG
jgi:NADH-quinone oxidoreductase subunit H